MEEIFKSLFFISPFVIIKIAILILLLLYVAFAFIVERQTIIMSKVVEADVTENIKLASLLHLFSTIFLFIWVLIFL